MKARHTAFRWSLLLAVLSGAVSGCSVTGGTLGGREKCWPPNQPRIPSLWRGILAIDAGGGRLNTPEGDVIVLLPGALTTRVNPKGVGELLRSSNVLARAGDNVTLFGGIAGDQTMVVCGLEEIHAPGNTVR